MTVTADTLSQTDSRGLRTGSCKLPFLMNFLGSF